MGLNYTEIHELLSAARSGASFDHTLTLGRQNLYLRKDEIATLIEEFDLPADVAALTQPFGTFAEAFLRTVLQIDRLDALDASAYDDATIIHDLNLPIAADLEQRFDAVVDGGTLEHVFNVPVALSNMMRMTKVGGRIISATPANNLCGHGFYQFSPELMFRVFSETYGFVVERIALMEARFPSVELMPRRGVYEVKDPDEVGDRVGLLSRHPALLIVHARKTKHMPDPWRVVPQQSDYTVLWQTGRGGTDGRYPLLRRLPPGLVARLRGYRQLWRSSLRNRRFYTKIS